MNKIQIGVLICVIACITSAVNIYPKCGNPSARKDKEKDCTPYGTDSGFLCCYILKKGESTPYCALISYVQAEKLGIKGTKDTADAYYSCGNSSSFLVITFSLFIFMILVF